MMTALEPITVTISHRLGREEAKRRIDSGLSGIRGEVAQFVKTLDYRWQDYRLDFHASVLLQSITGQIEVFDDFVRVELGLPRLLHLVAKTIAKAAQTYGFVVWDKGGAIGLRMQNAKTYTALGQPNPYIALFNGTRENHKPR